MVNETKHIRKSNENTATDKQKKKNVTNKKGMYIHVK